MGCTMGLSDDGVKVRIIYKVQTMHKTCQKSGFLESGERTIFLVSLHLLLVLHMILLTSCPSGCAMDGQASWP